MPRIRPASRSGWKTSSASVFSPVPMNLTARPVTALIESAAPPRASPSIFVRIRPVSGTASLKACATATASWPVIASTTRSVSTGLTAALTAAISAISSSSIVSRPAVSRMTMSRASRRAASTPPRAMSTTDVPDRRPVDRDVERLAERLELVGGGGPVRVGGDEQRPAALLDEVPGELRRRRRLARALEADERDDRRVALEVERPIAGAEQLDELVVDDLHDLLAGGQALRGSPRRPPARGPGRRSP